MATNWDKVKYISRVRPDSDDGRIDECNDSLDESEVRVKINDVLRETDEDGSNPNIHRMCPTSSRFRTNLKRNSREGLCLSVPQDIGRRNVLYSQTNSSEPAAEKTDFRKTSLSMNSLLYGSEFNGDIPVRPQALVKMNRRPLVKHLFFKQEESDTYYEFKVSTPNAYA